MKVVKTGDVPYCGLDDIAVPYQQVRSTVHIAMGHGTALESAVLAINDEKMKLNRTTPRTCTLRSTVRAVIRNGCRSLKGTPSKCGVHQDISVSPGPAGPSRLSRAYTSSVP